MLQIFQLISMVEMVFDRILAASGDEDHVFDPRLPRLIHRILDQRFIDNGQQFFRHGLRRGQKPRAKASDGENGFTNGLHRALSDKGGVYRPALSKLYDDFAKTDAVFFIR